MVEFDINKAARMMRVGNQFSETNQKLRKSVDAFINWFHDRVGDEGRLLRELGWAVLELRHNKIALDFLLDSEKVHAECQPFRRVVTNTPETKMTDIVALCNALAGPEGERLFQWLEQRAHDRDSLLSKFQQLNVS